MLRKGHQGGIYATTHCKLVLRQQLSSSWLWIQKVLYDEDATLSDALKDPAMETVFPGTNLFKKTVKNETGQKTKDQFQFPPGSILVYEEATVHELF